MTQVINRMERDGIVKRTPNALDKRSALVSLTDTAIARLQPAKKALMGVGESAITGLSDEDRAFLHTSLQHVGSNLMTR